MLHALIADCIENEKTLGLGEASLEELTDIWADLPITVMNT